MAAYLKRGDKGEGVKALQQALTVLGHPCGAIDGDWGGKTEAAVRAFQTEQNTGINRDDYDLALQLAKPKQPQTEHFTLAEFEVHDPALEALWQPIPAQYYPNLQRLMEKLEVLRHAIGDKPIIIRSGYRPPAYNTKVGGAGGSQHLYAAAADIYCPGRLPNCYQMGLAAKGIFYDTGVGGIGCGSNVNLHVDVRGTRAIWWYTYKTWDAWGKAQGPRG